MAADHTHPELEQRITSLEKVLSAGRNETIQPRKPVAIQEFILSRKPRTEVERTLAIAYFLERIEGLASFTVDDLRDAYSRAKEPKPKNLNDAVNKSIRKGCMTEARERTGKLKAWIVTNTGEKLVISNFSGGSTGSGED